MGKRRVTSMLEEADIAKLEAIARNQHVSLAWVVRDAVRAYLSGGSYQDCRIELGPANNTKTYDV